MQQPANSADPAPPKAAPIPRRAPTYGAFPVCIRKRNAVSLRDEPSLLGSRGGTARATGGAACGCGTGRLGLWCIRRGVNRLGPIVGVVEAAALERDSYGCEELDRRGPTRWTVLVLGRTHRSGDLETLFAGGATIVIRWHPYSSQLIGRPGPCWPASWTVQDTYHRVATARLGFKHRIHWDSS
jgi:hypothetical protein